MKLKALLNNQEHDLALEFNEPQLAAEVDGRRYSLEVHAAEGNSYLILNGTNVYDCRLSAHVGSRSTFDVTVNGNTFPITIVDPRRLRTDQDSDRHHHGTAEITAQMPGKVVKVLVEPGQEIAAGAGLMVVEAMKMQNEMKSPRSGVVVSVSVSAGDTVEAGALLAIVQ